MKMPRTYLAWIGLGIVIVLFICLVALVSGCAPTRSSGCIKMPDGTVRSESVLKVKQSSMLIPNRLRLVTGIERVASA